MRFRLPTTKMLPQKNGNRDWNVGYVSPENATQELHEHGK